MSRISLLLPSRERPDALKRLYESAMETADRPKLIEMIVYVDDYDDSYRSIKLPRLKFVRGPRIILSEMWNVCWRQAKGEIFHHCGDDNIFRSKGWDTTVRNMFASIPDKIAFVFGADGNGESERNHFGTHGFIHKNWTDTVGYFVPPYYSSDYNDTHLNDMAKALNRHIYVDILIEHMHFSLGKSPMDQNTKDRLARHEKDKPEDVYNSRERRIERAYDIERLRQFMENYGK